MKTRLILMASVALALTAAVNANAESVTKTYDFKGFDKIDAGMSENKSWKQAGKLDVNIVQSKTFKVTATFNYAEYEDIYSITEKNGTLYIKVGGLKSMTDPEPQAEVTVYMPSITAINSHGIAQIYMSGTFTEKSISMDLEGASSVNGLTAKTESLIIVSSGAVKMNDYDVKAQDRIRLDLSGASSMTGQKFTADEMVMDLSGAAKISDAKWQANSLDLEVSGAVDIYSTDVAFDNATMDLSGACKIKLNSEIGKVDAGASGAVNFAMTGQGESLNIDASGACNVDLSEFKCKDVELEASGMASVQVYASENLIYDMSGMASINYYGHPTTVSGPSNIRSH